VIAESFERIHRSNLVGMGVLPLTFPESVTRKTLRLDGTERFDLLGPEKELRPRMTVRCRIERASGALEDLGLLCRIDTLDEIEYYRHGGILHYVLRQLLAP
jgi:aconitate hydratase